MQPCTGVALACGERNKEDGTGKGGGKGTDDHATDSNLMFVLSLISVIGTERAGDKDGETVTGERVEILPGSTDSRRFVGGCSMAMQDNTVRRTLEGHNMTRRWVAVT